MIPRLFFVFQLIACAVLNGAPEVPGQVMVEICDTELPPDGSFPEQALPTLTYTEDLFGLFDIPLHYTSTGVRADRPSPTLVRARATVTLPSGKHRVLLRSRGNTRLLLDGKVVLETPFDQPRQNAVADAGELPVEEQDSFIDLGPGYRFAPPGNREVVTEIAFSGQPVRVSVEALIGRANPRSKRVFRPELGETVVAVCLEGSTEWNVLSPGSRRLLYTDSEWSRYTVERRARLDAMNTAARAARRSAHAGYWNQRRTQAEAWLAQTQGPAVPSLPSGFPAFNAIDHFIAEKLAKVPAPRPVSPDAPVRIDYHRQIKPLLEAQCYSCHQGSKVKGGLRLDVHEEALIGGNADGPAIVPHRPDESALLQRILSTDPDEVMPAKGNPLPEADRALLRQWIKEGADWPEFPAQTFIVTPLADDLTFLRRASLDTLGVVPSEKEIQTFLSDLSTDRRARLVDRLLADPRWADHQMGYWLDVLAENPNLINPTLNNTGPFRWWLYESFLDNKPFDLMVTELIRMEGSERFGGPAGFAVASQNDVPLATKAQIISSAFLGVEMKCARCHDAPTHISKQQDLFEIAAMLNRAPIVLPETSSVHMDTLRQGGRKPLIEVTLHPGSSVAPAWPFAEFCDEATQLNLAETPDDSRDRLAALITAPQNERFAQVIVNRLWQRLMGRGLVPTISDWEKSNVSHPELLHWLAREFVRSGYDLKSTYRLILSSHAYQRAVDPTLTETSALYAAPAGRRIAAEQLVDSFFAATGKPFDLEPVNLDVDSIRTIDNALDLGIARRAWMLASTSNERDRPSLELPRMGAVAEVLEVFGWRSTRPDPSSGLRDSDANVLQPALLSNGTMMTWLTRLSEDHGLTSFALEEQPLDRFVDRLFLRLLTRHPTPEEKEIYTTQLRDGFDHRRRLDAPVIEPYHQRRKFVAWSNHMRSEANTLRLEEQAEARRGAPPSPRLAPEWRQKFEDVIWALLNAPEWTQVR